MRRRLWSAVQLVDMSERQLRVIPAGTERQAPHSAESVDADTRLHAVF